MLVAWQRAKGQLKRNQSLGQESNLRSYTGTSSCSSVVRTSDRCYVGCRFDSCLGLWFLFRFPFARCQMVFNDIIIFIYTAQIQSKFSNAPYNSKSLQFLILCNSQIKFTILHNSQINQMLVFGERGKPEYPKKKTSLSRVENQQTQPTYDAESGNRTRDTLVEGERSQHCANLATTSISIKYWCLTLSVSDKKAACAAVEGFLKRRGLAPMECEIECCTGDNCNTNFPSFSKRGKQLFKC